MTAEAPYETRDRLFASLRTRNRFVGALRVAVPAVGLAVLLLLAVQVARDSLEDRFGLANLRIDRDKLVVDAPTFSVTAANGNIYSLTASEAQAAIGATDVIQVTGAAFTLTEPEGREITAVLGEAEIQTTDQLVSVAGTTTISASDGMHGTLDDIVWDVPKQVLTTRGPVALAMQDGTSINAGTMVYDGGSGIFTFTRVAFTLPSLPGDTP